MDEARLHRRVNISKMEAVPRETREKSKAITKRNRIYTANSETGLNGSCCGEKKKKLDKRPTETVSGVQQEQKG